MNKLLTICFLTFISLTLCAQPEDYEWTAPSSNSSESMPCGGGDIGMNVWVEQGDILFYKRKSKSLALLQKSSKKIEVTPS